MHQPLPWESKCIQVTGQYINHHTITYLLFFFRGDPDNLCGSSGPGFCYVKCDSECTDLSPTASASRLPCSFHMIKHHIGALHFTQPIPSIHKLIAPQCYIHLRWHLFECFVVCCPSCNTGCCVVSLWVCEWESKTRVLTDWVVKSVSHSWSIYSGVLIDWVVKSTNTNLYQDLFRCQSSLACDVGSGEILYREPSPRNNKWEKEWEPLR